MNYEISSWIYVIFFYISVFVALIFSISLVLRLIVINRKESIVNEEFDENWNKTFPGKTDKQRKVRLYMKKNKFRE